MYTPLPGPASIRLLQLSLPRKLRLTTTDLDVAPAYDALSYTWGPPLNTAACKASYGSDNDAEIGIVYAKREAVADAVEDGHHRCTWVEREAEHTVKVTRNLYEALVSWVEQVMIWSKIRGVEASTRYIWVDALCIDQESFDEKSSQIALMGNIYRTARRTVVWMGLDDPDNPIFDDLIHVHTDVVEQYADYCDSHGLVPWDDFHFVDDNLVFGASGVAISTKAAKALYVFYRTRTWMTRAWVVQEVICARTVEVLLGMTYIDFSHFGLIHDSINRSMPARQLERYTGSNSGIGLELAWLCDMRRELTFRPEFDNQYLDIMFYIFGSGTKRFTSDARDAICAYHGLALYGKRENDELWDPDYRFSTKQLFRRFTLWALQHSMEPWSFCRGSWVPDYSDLPKPLRYRWGQKPEFTACGDESSEGGFHGTIDDGVMSMEGRRCSPIIAVLRPLETYHVDDGAQYILNCLKFIEGKDHLLKPLVKAMSFIESDEEFDTKMSNTLLRACFLGNDDLRMLVNKLEVVPLERQQQYYQAINAREEGNATTEHKALLDEVDKNMARPSMNDDNVIYLTESGHIGRVYDAEIGDEVWLICAAKLPFVLRPVAERHILVSETFLPGAMFGEFLQNGIAGGRQLITFAG